MAMRRRRRWLMRSAGWLRRRSVAVRSTSWPVRCGVRWGCTGERCADRVGAGGGVDGDGGDVHRRLSPLFERVVAAGSDRPACDGVCDRRFPGVRAGCGPVYCRCGFGCGLVCVAAGGRFFGYSVDDRLASSDLVAAAPHFWQVGSWVTCQQTSQVHVRWPWSFTPVQPGRCTASGCREQCPSLISTWISRPSFASHPGA